MFNFPTHVLALGMKCISQVNGKWETREISGYEGFMGLTYDRIIFLKRPTQREWDAARASLATLRGDISLAYQEN